MESIILNHIVDLHGWRYVIIFLIMIVEGDIALFTTMFLLSMGLFAPLPLLVAIFGGAMTGDLCWFIGGRIFAKIDRWPVRFVNKLASPFDSHIAERPMHTLFISKYVYGIHHAIMFRAGALHDKAQEFFKDDILATLLWMLTIGGLGYLSGASFGHFKYYLRYGEVALFIAVIL